MKRLIFSELILLFLATAFNGDNPPGWFQQTLPRTDVLVQDIFFLDSLNGWAAAVKYPSQDSAFVFKTTNGGTNWQQVWQQNAIFYTIQFINNNTGYISGTTGFGKIYKTTDSGANWSIVLSAGLSFTDLYFVNPDTGWICDNNSAFGAGLLKTTDGGLNWQQQLISSFTPSRLFFLNKDTGWAICQSTKLYRTLNGGTNWGQIFVSEFTVEALFFLNGNKGWMRGGYISNTMGVAYTTDGGFNWTNAQGEAGGFDIKFVNDSIGYSGGNFQRITKSTNGGKNWGYQASPIANNHAAAILRADTLLGWAGGSGIVHTSDGGGQLLAITYFSNEIPKDFVLYQNYPNPFNPKTIIKYEITASLNPSEGGNKGKAFIQLKVFDINGKQITTLVNQKQNAGVYEIDFPAPTGDGSNLSSGVYFYTLFADDKLIDTKKMLLVK